MQGVVTECLPDARYLVLLDNGHQLVAYTAGWNTLSGISANIGEDRCRNR